jgi:hypothetical protein
MKYFDAALMQSHGPLIWTFTTSSQTGTLSLWSMAGLDITLYGHCLSSHGLDQTNYFIGGLLISGIIDDHIGTLLREGERNCPAYTPSTTSYDCIFAL